LLHGDEAHPTCAAQAHGLRERHADDHQQEGRTGAGTLGGPTDGRVEGLGGEGVGAAHQEAAEGLQDHVPYLRRHGLLWTQRPVEGQRQADAGAASVRKGGQAVREARGGDGFQSAGRVSRPAAFVHQCSDCPGENVGSDCGVCGASGPEDDASVHPFHAEGQAGDGELDTIRVLKSQIAGWVGHVSPKTTKLYTHFNTAESKKRMESLEIRF